MARPTTSAGRSERSKDGRAYVTLRVDPDLLERIDVECETRVVSRTYLFEKVMGEWLDEHEGDR